jgi:hypothetical protein
MAAYASRTAEVPSVRLHPLAPVTRPCFTLARSRSARAGGAHETAGSCRDVAQKSASSSPVEGELVGYLGLAMVGLLTLLVCAISAAAALG